MTKAFPTSTLNREPDRDDEVVKRQTEGLSFNTFRRMTMTLYLATHPTPSVVGHRVQVDPKELAEALLADAA